MDNSYKGKLCPFSFGMAIGVAKGLSMAVIAWIAMQWDLGRPIVENMASLYKGYDATVMGGVVGGLWGLLDGYLFGLVAGLVYNLLGCLRCKCKCGNSSCSGCCGSSCKCGSPSCPSCNTNRTTGSM